MIKPKVSDLISNRLPEWLSSKPQFVKFIDYYYQWIEGKGEPLDFIRNLIEYSDLDSTSDEFVELSTNKILSFLPADAVIDRKMFVKNIKEFILSKGSDESLQFIMKAVYGEDAYRRNMADYVLRPSDNNYMQDGFIAVEVFNSVKNNFSQCLGTNLIQLDSPASIKIEDASENASDDGRTFFVLKFDPRYLNGAFNIGSAVRAMKKYVDPTFVEITDYQTVVWFDVETKTLRMLANKKIDFFASQRLHKLGGGFNGIVGSVDQYFVNNLNQHDYSITLSSYTLPSAMTTNIVASISGTTLTVTSASTDTIKINNIISGTGIAPDTAIIEFGTGTGGVGTYILNFAQTVPSQNVVATVTISPNDETYFCSVFEENTHYTKNDFSYGVVSESIGAFIHSDPASGYVSDLPLEIRGGTGAGCDAFTGECGVGGVDSIIVLDGGKNYQIGDPVEIANNTSGGYGFSAVVSNVDGYGCELTPIMQIDSVIIDSGGSAYSVGDIIEISHLENLTPETPITLTVQAVSTESTATLTGFKILNSGKGYRTGRPTLVSYDNITVTDGTIVSADAVIVPITGLYVDYFTPLNLPQTPYSINASKTNFADSIVDVKLNIAPTPSILLGAATGLGETNAYLVFNGFGAALSATVSSGSITGIIVSGGGYAYLDPVVYITDTSGSGATARANKDVNGVITSVTVLSGGEGYSSTPTIKVYDRAGEGFVAQCICHNTELGGIVTLSTLNADQKGEFLMLPALSENIPFTPLSATTGNGAKLSLTYKVKRLEVKKRGSGYIKPFSIGGCSWVDGNTLVTTTKSFETVKAGMFVTGTGIPSRTTIDYVVPTSNINIKETQFHLSAPATATVSDDSISFNPNITISSYGIGEGLELFPVISAGELENVIILNGGSNYATKSTIHFTGGTTSASANILVSGGKVINVDMITYGSGYTENNFGYYLNAPGDVVCQAKVEADIVVSGTGSILSVNIKTGGRGYENNSTTKVYIEGSNTVDAELEVDVHTGVDIMTVASVGSTNAFLVSVNDNWKTIADNTGLFKTVQLKTAAIAGGIGGVLSFYITPEGKMATNGDGVAWAWISTSGTDYSTPTVTIGDGPGIHPSIVLGCTKKIAAVRVISGGFGYDENTQITITGTGAGCKVVPVIDGSSGITSAEVLNITNTNSGYVTYPKLYVDDTSYMGRISEVKIINSGSGFREFPLVKCEVYDTQIVAERYWSSTEYVYTGSGTFMTEIIGVSEDRKKPALGAKLLATSSSIGAIRKISQTKFGYGYREIPEILYPLVVIVDSVRNFKLGEYVSHSAEQFQNIGLFFTSVTSNGVYENGSIVSSPNVTITLTDLPTSFGIHHGQSIVFDSDTNKFPVEIAGKSFSVTSINNFSKSFDAHSSGLIPVGTYQFLLSEGEKTAEDMTAVTKSAKIINIDKARNMMWLSNVDLVYDYSEEVDYLAEGLVEGSDDGKSIITEHFINITDNKTLIGHTTSASAKIIWMNRASSLPVKTSVGTTKKYFTSNKGMLNDSSMRMTNSKNIQDFSLEVHTGYSVDVYSKLLKETVHPAGYFLSGVVEDTTDTSLTAENILEMGLPLTETGKTGDYVYIGLLGVVTSLYFLQNYDGFNSKPLYRTRMDQNITVLDNSIRLFETLISDFDLWAYPDIEVFRVKAENDDADYHVWGTNATPVDLVTTSNQDSVCTYTQTSTTLTVVSTNHNLKVGDGFSIIGAKSYNNRGKFYTRASVSYNYNAGNSSLTDITLDVSDNKWYKCISSYTSTGSTILECPNPAIDPTHWELSEGNLSQESLTVASVINANSVTVVRPYSVGVDEVTPRVWIKTYTSPIVANFARMDNLITVTSSNHGLVGGANSWIYGKITSADSDYTFTYSVVGSSSTVTVTDNNHGLTTGDMVGLSFYVENSNPPMVVLTSLLVTPYNIPTDGVYPITVLTPNTYTIINPIVLSAVSGKASYIDRGEHAGKYLNVTTIIDTNTFVVDTLTKGITDTGILKYWSPEDVVSDCNHQMTLKTVSHTISGINMVINGLSDHTLQAGNYILVTFDSTKKYCRIDSRTTSSITVLNPGATQESDVSIAFSFDQADIPESAYRFLTTHIY